MFDELCGSLHIVLLLAWPRAQETPAEAIAAVCAAGRPVLERRNLPGVALAAIAGGETAFGSLGIRDVDGKPIDADTTLLRRFLHENLDGVAARQDGRK